MFGATLEPGALRSARSREVGVVVEMFLTQAEQVSVDAEPGGSRSVYIAASVSWPIAQAR